MTNYYVAIGGNDGDPGTEAQPWATVNKVNISAFNADDQILFNRGDTWSGDNLVVPSSGTAGHPIVFGAYGTGANPVIDLCLEYNDFIIDAAAVWKRTPNAWDMNQVFEDGARLIHAANRVGMVQGSYFYDAGGPLVYVWCTDDGNPNTEHVVEHPEPWQDGIGLNGEDHITFDSIDVKRSARSGYTLEFVAGSNNITVGNCTSSWNYNRGFSCGGVLDLNLADVLFTNCTAHDNLEEGFWIGNGTVVMEDCVTYNGMKDRGLGYTGPGGSGGICVGINAVDCRVSDCHVYDVYHGYVLTIEHEVAGDAPLDTIRRSQQRVAITPGA